MASTNSSEGITDIEGAKIIAKYIFESYSKSNSNELASSDVKPMMSEAYECI